MPIRTFVPFNLDEDIVPANQTTVTTGLWSGDISALTSSQMNKSATQISASGQYYFDVFDKNPTSDTTASMTAAANTWEQVSISFTPTQNAVFDIYAYAYGGSTYTGYVDDLGASQ